MNVNRFEILYELKWANQRHVIRVAILNLANKDRHPTSDSLVFRYDNLKLQVQL